MADKNISVPAQSGGKIFLVPGGGSRTLFWGGKFSPDECQCKFLIRPQIFFSCFGFQKWRQTGEEEGIELPNNKGPRCMPVVRNVVCRCTMQPISNCPTSKVACCWLVDSHVAWAGPCPQLSTPPPPPFCRPSTEAFVCPPPPTFLMVDTGIANS